jgi:hypothetical protein
VPSPSPTPLPPTPAPTADPFFASQGGGEPRTVGYWLLWNSCAEGNKADIARANGGRAAGWVILDDLLDDPGILLGALLRARDADGVERTGDVAYDLAAQLNLAVGAEFCPAIFDGSGAYLYPGGRLDDRDLALALAEQL